MRSNVWAVLAVSVVLLTATPGVCAAVNASVVGQDPAPVPPLTKFSGTIPGAKGTLAVTFTIYADATGGSALWTETQNVTVDAEGRYTTLLGVTQPNGLPVDLFASGVARWVGVQAAGQGEQPRVPLVSVPYALKAGDANTVGGKPLSAFVLAGDRTGTGADGLTYVNPRALGAVSGVTGPLANSGTAGYLGMFTNGTDLGNSLIFQTGTSIGVNTTAPAAGFHSVATSAPGAFFDVFSNSLSALPVVFRAARGTPGAPTAVQTDDILGGLAVRGFGATTFSGGQGQVMFKAAENWTDTAHGTYLQLTTTPLGSATWVERLRISPEGYVGLGTSAPQFPFDVRLVRGGATHARFGTASAVPLFIIADYPHLGFNTYFDGGYKYGVTGYAGYLAFSQDVTGGFSFATAASGAANASASMATRMVITNAGRVGIGTTSPSQALDVTGNVNTTGSIVAAGDVTVADAVTANSVTATGFVTGAYSFFVTSGAGYYAVRGSSTGSGVTRGVEGVVNSSTGFGGRFENTSATGTALLAVVNGTEVLNATSAGVHAGPGMTGTPFAYGSFAASGAKNSGSSNLSCTWIAPSTRYDCTLTDASYGPDSFIAVVTPSDTQGQVLFGNTSWNGSSTLIVRVWNLSGTATSVQSSFHLVIYKP